ncbi:MAG TPA: hypothetical protein EYN41_04745 [Flavobacteriales bacterium]|nr:hypothetical protein [Flavobacteriales bacterium]
MKAILRRGFLLSFLIFHLSIGAIWAQDYTSSSKKAIKLYVKGQELYDSRQNDLAVVQLEAALEIDTSFIEVYLLLAGVHSELSSPKDAIDAYRKAVAIDPGFFPPALFNLASLELHIGDYANAKVHYKTFLSMPGMRQKYRQLSEFNISICDFAEVAMRNPVPFKPENLGPNVNSAYDEYYPGITADNDVLLYTRRIKDKQNYFGEQEDFYVSRKLDGKWSKCFNMGSPINTHYNEGSPTISPDGKIIIFSACDEIDGYGPNRTGYGSCDIFFVKKVGQDWSMPVNMGPPISSKAWDVQPSYASDGTTLYFVSQRKGSLGDADIWVSKLTDAGVWGEAKNLGPTINTPGREEAVFIHPDNQTLYFASNGHVGMGGLDIFMSKRQKDGSWGEPVNLGYPINTFNDENGLIVAAGGETAYFSSNREGGEGGLDMYQFQLHEDVRPVRVTYMKGKVYDSQTKKNLGSRFELIDLESGEVVVESYSDRVTGEFLVCLPTNKNYALNVSKKGYAFFSENFSLKKAGTGSDPFLMDVPLQRIDTGVFITLKNIFYESGSFDLRETSHAELRKLIEFLNTNANLGIEIQGHTDDVGGLETNQILSENRAKSVYQYLIDKGVDTERLSYVGYGETKPIRPNTNEADRAKNRRTVFKIISIGE